MDILARFQAFVFLFAFTLSLGMAKEVGDDNQDLTLDQLLSRLRPTLPPLIQGALDLIQADPVLRQLSDLTSQQRLERAISVLMQNNTYRAIIMEEATRRMQQEADAPQQEYTFPCDVLPPSNPTPTSVHELTPGDIRVVGAMGDSITAANGAGAHSVLAVLLQYRGQSWSIGGDDTFEKNPMLPNILRKYNVGIWGYSTGICRSKGRCAHFNVAIPAKTARDMAAQARELVEKIRNDPVVDFENDWKMVTIFIGQNDICSSSCLHPSTFTVEMYKRRLTDALDILSKNLPRTFVNLVNMVDAYECSNLNIGVTCTALHLIECPCGAFGLFYEKTKILNEAYQQAAVKVAESDEYDRDDFTVVMQPFFQKTLLPRTADGKVDLSYFAPDCFHFSARGHAEAAKSLWNNLLEPVGQKKTSWHQGEPYECPTKKDPYFKTRRNSKKRSLHQNSYPFLLK